MVYWSAVMRTLVFDKCKEAFMSLGKDEKQTKPQPQRTTLYIVFMSAKNHVFMLIKIFAIHRYLSYVAGNTCIFIYWLTHAYMISICLLIHIVMYIIWIYMKESTLMLIVMFSKKSLWFTYITIHLIECLKLTSPQWIIQHKSMTWLVQDKGIIENKDRSNMK